MQLGRSARAVSAGLVVMCLERRGSTLFVHDYATLKLKILFQADRNIKIEMRYDTLILAESEAYLMFHDFRLSSPRTV